MSAYKGYKNIERLTIQQRVSEFKDTAIALLSAGKTKQEMLDVVDLFVNDDQFEAAQGVIDAIRDFDLK